MRVLSEMRAMKASRAGVLICSLAGCIVDGHFVFPDSPSPGEVLWVRQLGGQEADDGRRVISDGNGDLVAIGGFRQALVTGPDLSSNGVDDIYVVKLAGSTGDVVWTKRLGGTLSDAGFGVAADGSGNIYIGGTFEGTIDVGGSSLTAAGPGAAFVLKLDANGTFAWARQVDGGSFSAGGDIATDGRVVVIAGNYTESITIDTTTHINRGSSDIFALKVSASTGETIWDRTFGGISLDRANGVAIDGNGNVLLAGTFGDAIDFGGGPLSVADPTSSNGFLVKLADMDGAHLFSVQLNSSKNSRSNALAIGYENEIVVSGDFDGILDLGCVDKLAASQADLTDVFLAKYTQAGSCIWAKGFGGTATSRGRTANALAIGDLGEVTVAGAFCGSISFGGEPLSSAGVCENMDVFVTRFNSDGMNLGAVRAGGVLDDVAAGIAQRSDGRFFVTGSFQGHAEFGRGVLTSVGDRDAFVAGFAPL